MEHKNIDINLLKIYGWPYENQFIKLNISLYSKYSQHLITRKYVQSTTFVNCLHLDINLKIIYATQENIVIIVITRINLIKDETLGEIQVNLDSIQSNKIRFFGFSNSDKILQISINQSEQASSQQNHPLNNLNARKNKYIHFLNQRKQFLQSYLHSQNQLRQSFSQQIQQILFPNKINQSIQPQIVINNQQQPININKNTNNQIELTQNNNNNNAKFSKHQEITTKNNQINLQQKLINQPQLSLLQPPSSPPYRKHKLILNTLNIIEKKQ